ncbi:MAG: hypothetical protein NWE95_11790 [Candidatus Bathyarchaeota archaeon]|nr:hypothetical protein [Candidatus Bathyarchaeota archaeon]
MGETQAKVYLVMTKVREAEASAFWKLVKVCRQDIYRVLHELQKTGLVEKVVTAPSRYRVIPLAEGVSILFQRRKREISDLQKEAIKIVETSNRDARAELSDQHHCVIIPEREATVLRVNQRFEQTQKSIDICTNPKRIATALNTYKFAEALDRGVNIRVIVNTHGTQAFEKDEQLFPTKSNFALRWLIHEPVAAYAVFDEKEVFVATSAKAGLIEAPILFTNFIDIAKLFLDHFNTKRRIAKSYQNQNYKTTI